MPATSLPATLVAALCLLCGVIAQGANYVDDASFDYSEPLPPRSAPRPAPAYRPTNLANAPKPTPVPILKQINRHNEDGSYTYGYEGADGAFKIETKLPNGEVMGKYGYVDESGKVRVVEYGANKYGFQPAGEGITVPPPTLVDESTNKQKAAGRGGQEAKDSVEYDDGQYYEEAPVRAAPQQPLRPAARPAPRPAPQPQYTPEDTFSSFSATRPAPRPAPQPQYTPQDTFSSFSSSQNFGPSRPVSASSVGPVPPRAAIPGAIPAGPAPSYSQPRAITAPLSRPLSASRQQQPTQGFFSPAPAPVYENKPVASSYEPRPSGPVPQRASYGRSTGSILDQLEKDYALPQNSAPALHDITFGSF